MAKKWVLPVVLLLLTFTPAKISAAVEWANPNLLLDAEQVKKATSKPNWIVLDCRSLKEYARGHIPGAVSFGKPCSKALRDATSRVFSDPAKYENILGKMGIGNNTHVVFYHGDIRSITQATVGFWVLEYLGHDKVHILNGGLEAWKRAGFPLDTRPTIKEPKKFKASLVRKRIATTDEIVRIAKGELKGIQVVDSRTEEEFKGTDIRAVRGGHLPNVTLNVPYQETLDKKRTKMGEEIPTGFFSPEVVSQKFESLDKNKRTIAHCQTGTRSTVTYFEFRLLGFKEPANWDESWRVYGSHYGGFPIENEQWFNFAKIKTYEIRLRRLEQMITMRGKPPR